MTREEGNDWISLNWIAAHPWLNTCRQGVGEPSASDCYGSLSAAIHMGSSAVEMLGSAQLPAGFPGLLPGQGWGLGVRYIPDAPATGTLLSTGSYGWSGKLSNHLMALAA